MKRLFNEYEAMTADANDILEAMERIVRTIGKRHKANGFSLRDVEQVMHSVVSGTMAEITLISAMEKRKQERSIK